MILTDDKLVEALEARRVVEDQSTIDEPPPTYASLSVGSSSFPEHTDQAPRGAASKPNEPAQAYVPYPAEFLGIKPTNYISISRVHNSIKETFLLDPGLYIPPSVHPSPEREENLRLESTHGGVHADVGIVPGNKGRRAKLWMKSTHGGVTAKIRTPSDPNHNLPPTSFHLTVQSTYGDVRVHLPRTFHGPLVLKVTHGSIKFSDALSGQLTTFGEADGTRRCFVGDFSGWRGGAWKGDEVVVEASHGSVKVVWEDDCVVGAGSGKGRTGFLNKVFGF